MGLRFRKSFKITPKSKFIVLGIVILAIIVALISQRSLTSLNVSWEKTSFGRCSVILPRWYGVPPS